MPKAGIFVVVEGEKCCRIILKIKAKILDTQQLILMKQLQNWYVSLK
jgi:hypothetical protein